MGRICTAMELHVKTLDICPIYSSNDRIYLQVQFAMPEQCFSIKYQGLSYVHTSLATSCHLSMIHSSPQRTRQQSGPY